MNQKNNKIFLFSLLLITTIVICQLADHLAVIFLAHQINRQLFFGLALGNISAVFISLLITAGFVCFALKFRFDILLSTIFIAAVISNIIDRIFYGGVVDYINFFGLWYNNIADILIVISIIILILNKKKSAQ